MIADHRTHDPAALPRLDSVDRSDSGSALTSRQWHRLLRADSRRRIIAWLTGGAAVGLLLGISVWQGWGGVATFVIGAGALGLLVAFGRAILCRLVGRSHPVTAVATAVIDEAFRTKATVSLLVLLVISLPTIPLILDQRERLAYRTQFFLEWSLGGAAFLMTMMTIFLACGTVCGDLESRRIHMTLCKPVARWHYLIGKWLGLGLVNLLLCVVVGVGSYTAARLLQATTAADWADRTTVDEQVLIARAAVRPEHPDGTGFEQAIDRAIEQARKDDPSSFREDSVATRERIIQQMVFEWHTVRPDVIAAYIFTGLSRAKDASQTLQLRLKPFANNVDIDRADVRFRLWLNDRPFPMVGGKHETITIASGSFHTLDLPTEAIDDEGRLRISMANDNLVPAGETRPTAISFTPGKGLELLYPVGSFAANLTRSMIVCWIKLSMIAAAALAAATWLGFPMAVLVSGLVYAMAIGSTFLDDAMNIATGIDSKGAGVARMAWTRFTYLLEALGNGRAWEACKIVMSWFGEFLLLFVPAFDRHDSVTLVATGQVVSTWSVLECLLTVGLLSSFVLAALGVLCFHNRELADAGGS